MVPEREIWDPLRRKKVRLTPEEQVRQWFITVLEREMGVPRHMMGSEVALTHAGKSYRADIVVYGRSAQPLMIVECKRPEVTLDQDVADQALRYNNELNVNYIAITNGTQTFLFQRKAEGWRALRQMPRWEEMAAPGPGDAAAADRPGARYLTAPIFRTVGETASELGVRAFVIGGFVRDCFLGRPNTDIDIVVEGSGIALAQAVAKRCGGAKVSVFRSFGTAMLRAGGMEVEFVGARKESYQRDSRKPIVEDGTLEEDQLRRDFTINAMAFSLQQEDFGALVDPFGGIRDLREGIIRSPLQPEQTYSDDPLRMLRAIRFAVQLSTPERQFTIVPESLEAMRKMSARLQILSQERIVEEVNKMLMTARPSRAFQLLEDTGLLPQFLPEVSHLKGVETVDGKGHKENFTHSLQVLDNVVAAEREAGREPNLWLHWAALLHDIGKPASKRYAAGQGWTFHGHEVIGARMVPPLFQRLKMPQNEKMKYVQKLVGLHLRPIALVDEEVTDSAVRRLLFDAGEDIEDLMLLCNADITSKNPAKVERLHRNFELVKVKMAEVEAKDHLRNWKNPITGEYVMELFGLSPCKEIGILKERVKNAILDGEIPGDFASADAFMRRYAAQALGLQPRHD